MIMTPIIMPYYNAINCGNVRAEFKQISINTDDWVFQPFKSKSEDDDSDMNIIHNAISLSDLSANSANIQAFIHSLNSECTFDIITMSETWLSSNNATLYSN